MRIQRTTLQVEESPQSLQWQGNQLMDWVNGGNHYDLNDQFHRTSRYFSYRFDAAKISKNGRYVLVYERKGTKGLLLKDGQNIREINRSYYQAQAYEYPFTFLELPSGRTAIAHCPNSYCQLDIEDVETGEVLTSHKNREAKDCFHSRLTVSQDQKNLISRGWIWHPWDVVCVYDIEEALKNPMHLDDFGYMPSLPNETGTASFIGNDKLLIGGCLEDEEDFDAEDNLPAGHLGVWDLKTKLFDKTCKPQVEFGNVIAINENYAWDLYKFPKIIDLNTGAIVAKERDINSGTEVSAIIWNMKDQPIVAVDKELQRIAIAEGRIIEILQL